MNTGLTYEDVFFFVRTMISSVTGLDALDIDENNSLVMELKMDSIELIDLLMRLEGAGCIVDEAEISSTLTVKQLSESVMRRISTLDPMLHL